MGKIHLITSIYFTDQIIGLEYVNIEACYQIKGYVCLFVCFVALRPKSTAMVIAGRSVDLTTLFPGQA